MKKHRKESVEYIVCDTCGKEISKIYVEYEEKDFCSNSCWVFFKYPTKEDYLKSLEPKEEVIEVVKEEKGFTEKYGAIDEKTGKRKGIMYESGGDSRFR